MKSYVIIALLIYVSLNTIACKNLNTPGLPENYNTENHPVRKLYLSSIDAFNNGELDLFLANFHPEVRMYGTDGNYIGKEALRKRFEQVMNQFPNVQMKIPQLELEMLSNKVVLVHFEWQVYPMGQGPAFHGSGSGIYQLINEKWLEVLEVETITRVDDALKQ